MASYPVLHAQLLAPKIRYVVARHQLNELGSAIIQHRVTTLVAPAGYGKSVWVASLLEQPEWPLTAWLSLDAHDSDPAYLLYHLILALKMILPDFGAESIRTLASVKSAALEWSIIVNEFIREIPLELDLVLVMDDFHLIHGNTVICSIAEHLIRYLPPHVHLVFISRVNLNINLYQQELAGDLLIIPAQQLLFSREETARLTSLLDMDLPAKDIADIHQHTEGWAVGLRLVAQVIKSSGNSLTQAYSALKQKNSNLRQYLNNELLASLPQPLQEFFMASALLPYLETELCNAAFKRSDSSVMLEELHTRGLLSQVQDEPVTWRMHHLIGEILSDYINHQRKPEYIARIRKRAGLFLEKSGNIDGAIEQAVATGEWSRAAGLINKYGYNYYMLSSRQESLFKWIDCLPPEVVNTDPWLLYYKAKSIIQIDDLLALSLLFSALTLASELGDIKCEINCLLSIINIHLLIGQLEQGRAIGPRIMATPGFFTDPRSRGEALAAALGYAIFNDDLRLGLKLSRQVLRLKLNDELRISVLYGSAIIQHRLGNLPHARLLLEEALAMPIVQGNERLSATIYSILATVLILLGDFPAAEAAANRLLQISQKYNMVADSARAYRALARMHWRENRCTEAQREFTLAYNCFLEGENTYAFPTAMELMLPRLKNGENAIDLFKEALGLLDDIMSNPVGQGGEQLRLSMAAIVAIEANQLDFARYLLEQSVNHWLEKGARINLAGCYLLLAHVHLLQGDERLSDKFLKKALNLAEAGQWVNFWEWHDETIYTMCSRAITKNIHINWACRILNRWFPQRCRQELGHLLIANHTDLNDFAESFFQDYHKNTGADIIHVFYLGSFRVFVNGREIPRQNWRTKKAETLFALLAAHRGYQSKEALIDQLWPDSNYKSGEASLRMALSHARQALGQHGPIDESVILYRGQIHLNPAIEVYNDYELFRERTKEAQQYRESASPYAINAMEAALHLYNGPFLEGDMDNQWVQNERISLQNLYLQILEKLALFRYETGNLASSLQLCQQYLALEPVEESIIRQAMQILHQTGHKRQALSLYRKLESDLRNEYNTPPDPETTILCQKII